MHARLSRACLPPAARADGRVHHIGAHRYRRRLHNPLIEPRAALNYAHHSL